MKKKTMLLSVLSMLLVASGCSSNSGSSEAKGSTGATAKEEAAAPKESKTAISTEPVTLKMYHKGGTISDEEFKNYFVEPVAKKYPNIKLELVRDSVKGNQPEELLSAGSFPDIIYTSNPSIPIYQDLDLIEDLNPLVKKHGLDLGRFQDVGLEMMKGYDANKLVGLPLTMNMAALIYNKDIFDKLGVAYPKDGMSWDEAITLGKRLTLVDNGVKYIGLDPWRVESVGSQMILPVVDPKTNKATLDNDGWAKVLQLFKDAVDVPGYVDNGKFEYDFFKDNLAMAPMWATDLVGKLSDPNIAKQKNWDLVSVPYVKGFEGKGRNVDAHMLMISKVSKHKDEAFAVIREVFSDEVQLAMAKAGRISPLKDEQFKKNYLAGNANFNGKNVAALFQLTSTPLPAHSKYENQVRITIRNAKQKLAIEKKDINTILRELQEESNKWIESHP
ncbi:ABC transporter substrate-binding protein [Paenibacillus cremeus]|uniref:Extracellular solute-binding protein n=1 Tax=Paenibacillus cremeus TaxID=2163881 RepID=A0A559KEK0_9BACL|nr:extracellular solute-binding protein [Paenibacillus cremeus]TVY10548.1 extracellular solute-binding protein [Paenibacillus cremeus]